MGVFSCPSKLLLSLMKDEGFNKLLSLKPPLCFSDSITSMNRIDTIYPIFFSAHTDKRNESEPPEEGLLSTTR
jgi:hypothetical protein